MEAATGVGMTGTLAVGVVDVTSRVFRSMAWPRRAIVDSAMDLVGVDLLIENGYAARCHGAMMAWC
jgi:hypothetical protein